MGALEGKVAIITGAGGEHGFGRTTARRFAEAGADVVVTDVAPAGLKAVARPSTGWDGLEAVAVEVQKAGRRGLPSTTPRRRRAPIASPSSTCRKRPGTPCWT